jgi:hypothetical protein
MLPALPDWALKLIRHAEDAPPRLLDAIRREGESARPALLTLVRGDYAVDGEFPDGGWARVHAARLLGELPPDDASLDLFIAEFEDADEDYLTDAVVHALEAWGAAVIDRVLPLAAAENPEEAGYAADVLAGCGVRDRRILDALLALLAADPTYARHLAEYGDPAALPALLCALDAYEFEEERTPICDWAVFELEDAIRTLGGTLTPSQSEKVERAQRRRRRALRDLGVDPDLKADEDTIRRGWAEVLRGSTPQPAGRPGRSGAL